MRWPSLSPEYNVLRASEERAKAEDCDDPRKREAHLELAAIFELRACEALQSNELH